MGACNIPDRAAALRYCFLAVCCLTIAAIYTGVVSTGRMDDQRGHVDISSPRPGGMGRGGQLSTGVRDQDIQNPAANAIYMDGGGGRENSKAGDMASTFGFENRNHDNLQESGILSANGFSSDISSDISSDLKSDIKNDIESDIQSDNESDIKNDIKSDIESDITSGIKSDIKSDINNDINRDINSDINSDITSDSPILPSPGNQASTLSRTSIKQALRVPPTDIAPKPAPLPQYDPRLFPPRYKFKCGSYSNSNSTPAAAPSALRNLIAPDKSMTLKKLKDALQQKQTLCKGVKMSKPSKLVRSNSDWQYLMNSDSSIPWIYVHSAYYDDRPAGGELPRVQVVGVGQNMGTETYCHVFYEGVSKPFIGTAVQNNAAKMIRKIDNGFLLGAVFLCPLPMVHPVPAQVSLSLHTCTSSSILVNVSVPVYHDTFQHEYGVCVSSTYGPVDPLHFIEWMELNSMLGVTEVNVYDVNITSPEIYPVFDYYTQRSQLRVRKVLPVVKDNVMYESVKATMTATLNGCLMENMYRYRHLVIIDLDEFIIPTSHCYIPDLVREYELQYSANVSLDLAFMNSFFDEETVYHEGGSDRSNRLRTMTRLYRNGFLDDAYPKSILNPRECASVYNHYCMTHLADTGVTVVEVSARQGSLNHYRNQVRHPSVRKKQYEPVMLRYETELVRRVERVLQEMGRDGTGRA